MDYREFAAAAGLPEDLEEARKPEEVLGYFQFLHTFADDSEPYIRLVTMSKDLALGFARMSDETRARFITALAREAKHHQEEGKLLTIDYDGHRSLLVSLVKFTGEYVLHVEKR